MLVITSPKSINRFSYIDCSSIDILISFCVIFLFQESSKKSFFSKSTDERKVTFADAKVAKVNFRVSCMKYSMCVQAGPLFLCGPLGTLFLGIPNRL